jgi:hypothetical protein
MVDLSIARDYSQRLAAETALPATQEQMRFSIANMRQRT